MLGVSLVIPIINRRNRPWEKENDIDFLFVLRDSDIECFSLQEEIFLEDELDINEEESLEYDDLCLLFEQEIEIQRGRDLSDFFVSFLVFVFLVFCSTFFINLFDLDLSLNSEEVFF